MNLKKIAAGLAINVVLVSAVVLLPLPGTDFAQARHTDSPVTYGYGYGYGYMPGWGHGDDNHEHSGPPKRGNVIKELRDLIAELRNLLQDLRDRLEQYRGQGFGVGRTAVSDDAQIDSSYHDNSGNGNGRGGVVDRD